MTLNINSNTYGWSWFACILGPIWYLINGIFMKGVVLLFIDIFTIGLAIPVVAIYTGIKGKSDLYERQLSKSSRISPNKL